MEEGTLPSGTVTFLLTDIEGSTRLWEEHPEAMRSAIARHDALIQEVVVRHRGALVRSKGEGDSTFSAFRSPVEGVSAAVEMQRALGLEPWPEGIALRVRAALHTGEAELREGDYYGVAVNRCARLRSVAHGGQVVCSDATRSLAADRLPDGVSLEDLGLHRLRDLSGAERIFQLRHPDLPADFPPLLSLGVRHNLPTARTSFVGRDADLKVIRKMLATDRLVTLTGVGGCGKTRLAVQVVAAELERFPDGVFFVDLVPVSDPDVVAGTIAAAVGFSRMTLGTGSGRPAHELLDFLESRRVLILLDNCEHVVDACAHLVDEMLERCRGVSILATSREALEIPGERLYAVSPLETSDDDPPASSDAVRLFCDRAAAARPGFQMTADGAADVAEICRRIDGIPLAIELAAAHVAHLSPRQIADRLDDRFGLLTGGRRRAERQRTLQATLDWSYDLLDPNERVTLRRLAVFSGAFALDAAEATCAVEDVTATIGRLVAKSLVMLVDDEGDVRYRLLDTVRAYAESKLVEAVEESAVRDRHRDHFLAWAESIQPELLFMDPSGEIRSESHNLRAAIRWSEQQGRPDLVGRIASTMSRVWTGSIREGRRWLRLGVEHADEIDSEHRTRVLTVAAHVAVLAIRAQDGVLARKAVEACDDTPGMWPSYAHALLAFNSAMRGRTEGDDALVAEAERLGTKALALSTHPLSEGLAWFYIGQGRIFSGDIPGAVDALRRASTETIPGGDMSLLAQAMLAGLEHLTGDHDAAFSTSKEVLQRARSAPGGGLWSWALYCSTPYALELGSQGRHAEALNHIRGLVEEGSPPRIPGIIMSVVLVLGALALLRGDEEGAGVLLEFVRMQSPKQGIRTPVDVALLWHYLARLRLTVEPARFAEFESLAERMTLDQAVTYGLRLREPV